MGNNATVKLMRRQIRNVTQESFPDIMQKEIIQAGLKVTHELIEKKLEHIAETTTKQLEKIDSQTQMFRSMMMRDLSSQLAQEVTNVSVTMLAWQEVLASKLAGVDMTGFDAEVAEKKKEIFEKLQAEADARQKAEDALKAAAPETAPAVAEGTTEQTE